MLLLSYKYNYFKTVLLRPLEKMQYKYYRYLLIKKIFTSVTGSIHILSSFYFFYTVYEDAEGVIDLS